jgi:dihydroflavonol-4-reductase
MGDYLENVLVTGAAGHVGLNLVKGLLKEGRKVRAMVNRNRTGLDDLNVEIVKGNVSDRKSLDEALKGIDVVYHCAAKISIVGDPDGSVWETNVNGVKNMAEASLQAGVKRFVHISSCHAFQINNRGGVVDENTPKVTKGMAPAYDYSKAKGEEQLRMVIAKGLDAVIINPTGVIGPNDLLNSRMGEVILDIYSRKLPALINGGFDFVDVRDVVKAAINAEKKGRTGENYLISGRHFTVRELANIIKDITGVNPPAFDTPIWLVKMIAPFAEKFAQLTKSEPLVTRESLHALNANKNICHYKAQKELDHVPTHIKKSIRDVFVCFKERGVIPPEAPLLEH